MNVFLDTNILLDALLQREPFLPASARVWSLADAGKIRGYVSAISFNNVFYLVRRQENQSIAREAMRLMRHAFTTVPLDDSVIEKSIRSGIDDFEDAIQYFSALKIRAKYLVTRNARHFPTRGPQVISPEHFLALAGGTGEKE